MPFYYAGVGSRATPEPMCEFISKLGARLYAKGFILRSGGASGADQAFELRVPAAGRQVFVPSRQFGRRCTDYIVCDESTRTWDAAQTLVRAIHPAWNAPRMVARYWGLDNAGQRLHTRNAYQVLGLDLCTPVSFVICWARWKAYGLSVEGGTNTAVKLALMHRIPVFNLIDGQSAIDALGTCIRELLPD